MLIPRTFLRSLKPCLRNERVRFSVCKRLVSSSQSCDDEDEEEKFVVVSLYHLDRIDKVNEVTEAVKSWLQHVKATGRFQINKQGVNCQLCFHSEYDLDPFTELLGQQLNIDKSQLRPKVHLADFNVFKRLRVKHKLLESLDDDIDISDRGEHLDRQQWNEILDNDGDNALVIDIRNGYEWDVGRFKQAHRPTFTKFSQFKQLVNQVVENIQEDRERKVMMYCTGGIRCELFSSLLKKEGVKNVYQLQDGVLGYG